MGRTVFSLALQPLIHTQREVRGNSISASFPFRSVSSTLNRTCPLNPFKILPSVHAKVVRGETITICYEFFGRLRANGYRYSATRALQAYRKLDTLHLCLFQTQHTDIPTCKDVSAPRKCFIKSIVVSMNRHVKSRAKFNRYRDQPPTIAAASRRSAATFALSASIFNAVEYCSTSCSWTRLNSSASRFSSADT